MAVTTKTGTFQTPTTTVPISISGLGFSPKAIIFFATKRIAGGVSSDVAFSFGFTGGKSGPSMSCQSESGLTTTNTCRRYRTHHLIMIMAPDGSELYRGNLSSLDQDGFTIQTTKADSTTYRISYFAIGGSDIKEVDSNVFNFNAVGPTHINVGFQPDVVMMITQCSPTGGGTLVRGLHNSIGWAVGPEDGESISVNVIDVDGLANTTARRYMRSNKCIAAIDSGNSAELLVDFVSFDSTGFNIDVVDVPSPTEVMYLAIKGGVWKSGTINSKTTTGLTPYTVGVKPKGIFMLSDMGVSSNTGKTNAKINVGACAPGDTSLYNLCAGFISEHGVPTSNSRQYQHQDSIFREFDDISFGDSTGRIDIASFDANGFTVNEVNATVAVNQIGYLVVGDDVVTKKRRVIII